MTKILITVFLVTLVAYQTYASNAAIQELETKYDELSKEITSSIESAKASVDNTKNYITAIVEQESLELQHEVTSLLEILNEEEQRASEANKNIGQCSGPLKHVVNSLNVVLVKCRETETVATAEERLHFIEDLPNTLETEKAACKEQSWDRYVYNCLNYHLVTGKMDLDSAKNTIDSATRQAALNSMECIQEAGSKSLIQSAEAKEQFLECVANL